jgi:hemerythrin
MGASGWEASLDTGHPSIDEQHRALVGLHGEAVAGARDGRGAAAQSALQDLLDLTQRHFSYEEQVMEEADYPSRGAHVDAHGEFLRDLVALVGEASRDACSPLVRLWLESRYASWWRHHLRSFDLPMAAHVIRAIPIPKAE